MEELRDIKGLVEVTDYSFYYLLGVIALVVVLLAVAALLLYRYLTKKSPRTQREIAIERLERFEFGDAKESVYRFSHLAQYAVTDAHQKKLEVLLADLEPYKFKKEVPKLDEVLKSRMQAFIEELRRG